MNRKNHPVLAFLLMLFVIGANAQAQTKICTSSPVHLTLSAENINVDNKSEVVEPFDGTYRFIFTKGKRQFFTDEILKTIEQNRKEDEETLITLSPYCKLQILSRKQIKSAEFIPFSKSYVFEN